MTITRPRSDKKEASMCRRILATLAAALLLPMGAAAAERMTDEQVKRLIQDIG